MKKILILGSLALAPLLMRGQLVVGNTLTPEELVQNVLLGTGVTVSNITFNGGAPTTINEQAGTFDGTAAGIGIPNGVILATGNVQVALGPNNGTGTGMGGGNFGFGDPDLTTLSGVTTNDAAILEFDFIPSGDSISFRFVFASEEYPEYVCGTVNDVFGFFLSGPGITGPFQNNATNLALVPGGIVPISINTVNPGVSGANGQAANCTALDPNWPANNVYYQDNTGSQVIQFDGQTVVFIAQAQVECNQQYHIKLAIADGGDTAFDSAVFLESSSFTSTPFIPTLTPGPGIVGNNTILESCYPVTIDFIQTGAGDDTSVVYITVGGTATAGIDYVPPFPDSLVFYPGDTVQSFTFNCPIDPDGQETVILTLVSESPCAGTTVSNEFIFYIESSPQLVIVGGAEVIPCLGSATLTPTVSGGYPPYTIAWNNGLPPGPSVTVSPIANTVYTATVTDDCGSTSIAQFFVELEPLPPINMELLGPGTVMEACQSTSFNIIRPQGVPGPVDLSITFNGAAQNGQDFNVPTTITIPEDVLNTVTSFDPLEDGIPDDGETVTIIATFTDDCGRTVSDSVTITIVDAPPIQLSTEDFIIECQPDSMLLTAVASGGVGQLSFSWSTGDQGPSTYVTMQVPGTYTVTATDECGRSVSDQAIITVECDVIIPNVITPNGDGYNDKFEIEGITYSSNTLAIFNRWGQKVYEVSNYSNQWDGGDLPDGTYYYEVVLTRNDRTYTGSLTILRNGW